MSDWYVIKPYHWQFSPRRWPADYRRNRQCFGRLRSAWLAVRGMFACQTHGSWFILDNFGVSAEQVKEAIG